MINFRQIFNPEYIPILIIIIIITILLIFIINKNLYDSLNQIISSSFIAGIVSLLTGIILKFLIAIIIPSAYQIILKVISLNLTNTIIKYSITLIIVSVIMFIMTKILIYIQAKKS